MEGGYSMSPDQVLVMGRSIGGAVAVDLADPHQSRAMILESAFPSRNSNNSTAR